MCLLMPDKTQAEEFGEWLSAQRSALGITVREAARRAGISEGQWGRIEKGESGTKRMTLSSMLSALRISQTSDEFAEGFRKAGYSPIDSDGEGEGPFNGDDFDMPAYQAFLLGLPKYMQKAEFYRVRQLWIDNQRSETTHGKKAED